MKGWPRRAHRDGPTAVADRDGPAAVADRGGPGEGEWPRPATAGGGNPPGGEDETEYDDLG